MNQIPKKSLRILLKAVLLFVVFNYAFSFLPNAALWQISLYNTLLPGKTRFPLEKDLDLIFNVHEIANSPSQNNEYKVIVLGDSATWGHKLNPDETFSSIINASQVSTCKGQTVHIYNLAYPVPLVFRDALILQRALTYKPDLILWNVTLVSMLESKKDIENNIIIKNNLELAQQLNNQYDLATPIEPQAFPPQKKSFLDRRKDMARFIKHQLNGIRWQATLGELVDKHYAPLSMDVKASKGFASKGLSTYNILPPRLNPNLLQFDVLNAGILMAGDTPLIIINEPIQVVNGKNSQIRYNEIYPRWVYDQYREAMNIKSAEFDWNYIDLWNIIPPTQFSDTSFHRATTGEKIFSQAIKDIVLKSACP